MRRPRLALRGLPRRESIQGIPARRLALVVFLGVLGVLGVRSLLPGIGLAPKPAPPRPDPQPVPASTAFSAMRPRAGDQMTPPQVGFRWSLEEGAVSQASMVPQFLSRPDSAAEPASTPGALRYVLHVVGPGGIPHVTRECASSRVTLTLDDRFPAGECEWWVEAIRDGTPPLVSPRERFTLLR